MNITSAMKQSIIAAANAEYERLNKEVNLAYQAYAELQGKRDEALRALKWAQELQVGAGFALNSTKSAKPRNLWFFASRSGKTLGHFIEKRDDGTWSCSCSGFNYRADCWASRLARQYDDAKSPKNRWYSSYFDFDSHKVPSLLTSWRA